MTTESNEPETLDEPAVQESKEPTVDWLFGLIRLSLCVVVFWILLTPFVPGIARTTMERFHLRAPSFALWAAQFPIPSMYNFGNQVEVREVPDGLLMATFLEKPKPRYINHFPTRMLTFGAGRFHYLSPGKDRWATFWSSYRGQVVETKVHAKPIGDGNFAWIREAGE